MYKFQRTSKLASSASFIQKESSYICIVFQVILLISRLTSSLTTTLHTTNTPKMLYKSELRYVLPYTFCSDYMTLSTLHVVFCKPTLTCRLINPAKSDSGKIRNLILDKINTKLRTIFNVNQWRNTQNVIRVYWFGNIEQKTRHSFISFDIIDFYPSISENLLDQALSSLGLKLG